MLVVGCFMEALAAMLIVALIGYPARTGLVVASVTGAAGLALHCIAQALA